jgi:hypothetical protein
VLRAAADFSGRRSAVVDLFNRVGVDAHLLTLDEVELRPDRILWLDGTPIWYRSVFSALRELPVDERPFVLFWHSEPLPSPRAAGLPRPRLHTREVVKIALCDLRVTDPYSNIRALRSVMQRRLVSLLLISTAGAREFLAENAIDATRVPLPLLPDDGRDLALDRDIDVLFLGAMDVPRRKRIVRDLRRAGVAVTAVGGWGDANISGEPRARLLNRTKILLNLPRHRGLLSGRRMLLGMANKALVLAEPIYRPEPYRPGEHYVSAELAEMPSVIEALLADDATRTSIAQRGHDFARAEMTLEQVLPCVLALIEERS